MTPEQLDTKLRTLSEHELAYRSGVKPTDNQLLHETVQVKGHPALRSRFGDRALRHWAELGYGPNDAPAPHLFIGHHARFREYPLHFHDFVELSYMYSGSCMEVVNNGIYGIKQGQVLLVDSDTVHTISPMGEDDVLLNIQIEKPYFNSNFFNRLDSGNLVTSFFVNAISKSAAHDNFILFHSENSRRLAVFMQELLCEYYDPSPRPSEIINGLFSLVISELINVYAEGDRRTNSPRLSPVVPVLRYIEQHYADCTLEQTAREFGMSTSYLTKLIKRETGSTFKVLVQQQRMAVARRLLQESDLSVTDVARNVGYANMSFFYRVFEREYGMRPGECRRRVEP